MAGYIEALSGMDSRVAYSLEAEQSVLGAIILDSSCMGVVLEYLSPDCFYDRYHQGIFGCALRMFTMSRPVDAITLLHEVISENLFETEADAKKYIAQLVDIVPSVSNVAAYAKIVQEKYHVRLLMETAREIIEIASEGGEEVRNLLDFAEERIFQIRQGKDARGLQHIRDVILTTYDHLQQLTGENREKFLPLASGFPALDYYTSGLGKSDLIVLGARPGVGKTSFVLNIAKNVAVKYPDRAIAIFQLEMSADQLAGRLLSGQALVDSRSLRTGVLRPDQWQALAAASDILSRCNILIDDSTGVTVPQMKAKLRRVKNLGLVIIDYLQLMSSGRNIDNRVQEVSEITRGLKIMAKEMNVPVLLCAQLSRDSEKQRTDGKARRPGLADLRESGSIEQDADQVYLLYKEKAAEDAPEADTIEVIVAKNRHGETGTVTFRWDGPHMRFLPIESGGPDA